MTEPSGLDPVEAATVASDFGVALEQVRRDYLISMVLSALQVHADDLIFFGGTALARTYLTDGRLSEDIDLIAIRDRPGVANAISRTIDRALQVTHGRPTWSIRPGTCSQKIAGQGSRLTTCSRLLPLSNSGRRSSRDRHA